MGATVAASTPRFDVVKSTSEVRSCRTDPDAGGGRVPGPGTANHSENLLALQKLSEQTAQLHRQFLDGQDKALGLFQTFSTSNSGCSRSDCEPATARRRR